MCITSIRIHFTTTRKTGPFPLLPYLFFLLSIHVRLTWLVELPSPFPTHRKENIPYVQKRVSKGDTLRSVFPEVLFLYPDFCFILKTHSCSFVLAFLYCHDHHSMWITILTNKTTYLFHLLFDLVSSIFLCCFWSVNNFILHVTAIYYDPCSLSQIVPIWFPLGFVIAIHWKLIYHYQAISLPLVFSRLST